MAYMSLNIKMLSMFVAIFILDLLQEVSGIGVNYGLLGNDLPRPDQSITLLKSKGINKIRIFTPDKGVLNALRGTGIEVYIGTLNEDLPRLSQDPSFAANWVQTNVAMYANNVKISGIVAGNELETNPLGAHVYGAMINLDNALHAANIIVPVTTTVSYGVMGVSYPPSAGAFNPNVMEFITGVTKFLSAKGYPLLANVYPYFPYAGNPKDISADYALLTGTAKPIVDGPLSYNNLLVAMVDALYSALEKVGAGNVRVVVSETGWPSAMGAYATIQNAKVYNNNLVRLVESSAGTPKRPNTKLDVYIFALFNENQKPGGIEQHWGLFYPNLNEVYHVDFGLRMRKSFKKRVFPTNKFQWSLNY